jgi:adenylate cyclase
VVRDKIPEPGTGPPPRRLTFLQRRALKDLVKFARKGKGEPLTPADWESYWRFGSQPTNRAIKRMLRALPSRKNPNICAMCIELAPPGGMTTDVGVLFADLRGFTSRSESITPTKASEELRAFYAHAEEVFFPEAIIDKLIGDEVMALYLPIFVRPTVATIEDDDRRHVAAVMLDHARQLLDRVGYGSPEGPALELGIGLDFGEAFIGNVGNAALHDFTAVGDVVNTASRLQGHAASGEVVVSARLASLLGEAVGVPERLVLKGKQEPFEVRRVRWFAPSPSAAENDGGRV